MLGKTIKPSTIFYFFQVIEHCGIKALLVKLSLQALNDFINDTIVKGVLYWGWKTAIQNSKNLKIQKLTTADIREFDLFIY